MLRYEGRQLQGSEAVKLGHRPEIVDEGTPPDPEINAILIHCAIRRFMSDEKPAATAAVIAFGAHEQVWMREVLSCMAFWSEHKGASAEGLQKAIFANLLAIGMWVEKERQREPGDFPAFEKPDGFVAPSRTGELT
jgi:hypothetical protein